MLKKNVRILAIPQVKYGFVDPVSKPLADDIVLKARTLREMRGNGQISTYKSQLN